MLGNLGAKQNLYFIFSTPPFLFKKRSRDTEFSKKIGHEVKRLRNIGLWYVFSKFSSDTHRERTSEWRKGIKCVDIYSVR